MKIYHKTEVKASNFKNGRRSIKVDEDEILTIRQVAEKLQIAVPTIYVMVREKGIPHIWVRGSLRFRRGAIDTWLDDNSVQETTKKKA